ncbi:MAG: nucleotidyltransferase-like protein, partial [Paenibacillus sp.]|nr:nucleotidyltransferase-like protein [Paenibacillus sp.]
MLAIQHYIFEKYWNDPDIISVSVIRFHPSFDGLGLTVLVIAESNLSDTAHTYYKQDGIRIQEHRLHPKLLEQLSLCDEREDVIHWISQGEIVMDRNLYLEGIRSRLLEFPEQRQGEMLIVEFDRFLRSYLLSKQCLADGHHLDAYSNILTALCHWARIAIIERGIYPETLVWSQVRKINPGVYKFYEELSSNSESLEKRIQLVLLACEFSVMSKMESCCSVLLDVLRSREQPWSLQELLRLPHLTELQLNLSLLLHKLARKSLIREIVVSPERDPGSALPLVSSIADAGG